MNTLEKKFALLEYQVELLIDMMPPTANPLSRFIIKNKLTREEVQHILSQCERLDLKYKLQKDEGFLHFKLLFNEFKLLFQSDLIIREAVNALEEEGHCVELMKEFKKIILKEESKIVLSRR